MSEVVTKRLVEGPLPTPDAGLSEAEKQSLREQAVQAARVCGWIGGRKRCNRPRELFRESARMLNQLERDLVNLRSDQPSDDLQWLYDNIRLVRSDIQDLESGAKLLAKLPAVKTQNEDCIPRPVILSRALLEGAQYQLTEANFYFFIQAVEEIEPLRLAELGGMLPALKLVLLELLADRGFRALEAFKAEGAAARSWNIGQSHS